MTLFSKRDGVTLALVILGVCAGLALSYARASTWRSFGAPPATAAHIVAATQDTVLVEATDGQVYAFRDNAGSYWVGGNPQGAWTAELPRLASWEINQCSPSDQVLLSQSPPSAMRESVSCQVSVELSTLGLVYAILDDGTVWRWSTPLWPHSTGSVWLGMLGALSGWLVAVALFGSLSLLKKLTTPLALGAC